MTKKKNTKLNKFYFGLLFFGLIIFVVGVLFIYFGSKRDEALIEECIIAHAETSVKAEALGSTDPPSSTIDWDLSKDDSLAFDWDYTDVPTFSFTVRFVNYPFGYSLGLRFFFSKVNVNVVWYDTTGQIRSASYNGSRYDSKDFVFESPAVELTSLSFSGTCFAGSSILEIYSFVATSHYENVYSYGYNFGHSDGYDDGYDEGQTVGYQRGVDVGYADGFHDGTEDGYADGYVVGKNDGYELGYDYGEHDGYNLGVEAGRKLGQEDAYNRGHEAGYSEGLELAEKGDFLSLFTSLIDAPVSAFTSLLDFEIFGYNIKSLVLALMTAALAITALKFFMGMGG